MNRTASSTFGGAGLGGNYSSSHASSTTAVAHWLGFSTTVSPSAGSNRYIGIPLRCLSTVLDI